jgi:exportin-7
MSYSASALCYQAVLLLIYMIGTGLLFDWLYPTHFPVVRLCLEAWADSPEVTTALLRFMAEFVMNKNTRLAFDSSSPNGILLFREVSKVCCVFVHDRRS